MEELLNTLTDESQRLFFASILAVIVLAIALVIVIFVSRIKFLKDRLFAAKEIDLSKNEKIAELQKKLKEIKIKDDALTLELQHFNETKVSLKSKKELILKMQEKMDLLEKKERLHLETVERHIKDYQTLTFKYKGLKKRNEFLVEENSRFRTDNTKMLLKVREQERRIFEKLLMVHGNKEEQRKEIEKLAEGIFEKNRQLFDALQHETIMARISPLADEVSHYQKEVIFGHEKSIGKERDLQEDIVSRVGLYQKVGEDIGAIAERLRDEEKLEHLGINVLAYILDASGIDKNKVARIKIEEEEKQENTFVTISLPDRQTLVINTTFSLLSYEHYRKTMEPLQRERERNSYIESLKKHIAHLAEKVGESADNEYCWMLLPTQEALQMALRHESRLYDQALKKHVVLVGPTTLLVALQSVAMLWEHKRYYKQASELASRAEMMYEQFALFGEEMSSVSQRLEMVQKSLPVASNKSK
jgi:DNA recombination protein RmuC